MRRILPLVLATSALVPVLTAGDAPTPMPAVPTSNTAPAVTPPPMPAVPAADPSPVVAPPAPVPVPQAQPAVEPKPAEVKPADTQPVVEAKLPEGAFVTTMKANGNVRYGPNRSAKVALTMKAGDQIVVLGAARGAPDWLLVRLPRDARVWMHRKVLTPQDGGKTFIVNEDRAKARDDSTLGGNIVCEVEKGEIVEAKGRQNGDWHAVQVPSATAYVHASVLTDSPQLQALLKQPPPDRTYVNQLWEVAQKRYDAYQAALNKDLTTAAILDWNYLSLQLSEVVAKHPDSQVQAAAKRMQDGIAKVVRAVDDVQRDHQIKPVRDVPGQPPIPEPREIVAQNPQDPVPAVPNQGQGQNKPPTINVAAIPKVIPDAPKPKFPAEGSVMEQAHPGVGVNHVIIDENQNVLAFLKEKDGAAIKIGEYLWRNVGVKGEKVAVDPSKHKLGKDIPLILVEDLVLLKQ